MRSFRIILFFLLILLCPVARAQSLSVESFRLLENDLTANTYGTMERDQNGEVTALIKVVTTETGFSFDAGMLGVVKTTQKVGEIWLYVPYGLQRITIAHQEFGVLRDYYFPVPIEKARTYEMRLTTPVRVIEEKSNKGEVLKDVTVTIQIPTSKAAVYVDDKPIGVGSMRLKIEALKEYNIEVKKDGYYPYTTKIRLEPEEDGKTIEIPELKPLTATLLVNCKPDGAKVIIGGIQSGTTPLRIENVRMGLCLVEVKKRGYYSYDTRVNITQDTTYIVDRPLKEKMYLKRNGLYVGAGYMMGHLPAIEANAGFYWGFFNMEGNYLMSMQKPLSTYWVSTSESFNGKSSLFVYNYKAALSVGGSLGARICVGKKLRVTPQLGVMYYALEGTYSTELSSPALGTVMADSDTRTKTYVFSGRGAARMEFGFSNHMSLLIAPSYEIPVKMGDLAKRIDDNCDVIKDLCGGLSIKAGLELYF